jgi:O-antigen ligase
MWQISWELFKHNPFYGYGDNGFRELLNEPWITSIASPEAREIILFNGPHNEFLANLIRSGFMGGLSVLCLFFIPLDLFWRNRNIPQTSKASHLGLSFITCLIICSISSEVLTLKYTNTFYGLIIASLTAQIFQSKSVKDQKAS